LGSRVLLELAFCDSADGLGAELGWIVSLGFTGSVGVALGLSGTVPLTASAGSAPLA